MGKIDRLLAQIKAMEGVTFEDKLAAYSDLVEERLRVLPKGEEWDSVMSLLGLLRGGLRRFERDFRVSYLPPAQR